MKKRLFTLICTSIIFINAGAQKNTILVGGDFLYQSQSNDIQSSNQNQKINDVAINPVFGYQFTENITAGMVLGLAFSKTDNITTIQKSNFFNAGPFIRYTKKLSEIFFLYGQFEVRAGTGENSFTYNNNFGTSTSQKFSQIEISAFPALFLNIHKGFGLNFMIGGIAYETYKPKGEKASNAFGLTFGRTLGIGISKNF